MRIKNLQRFGSRVFAQCAEVNDHVFGSLRRSNREERVGREMAKRLLLPLSALALSIACGGATPTSPTSTSSATFAIRGSVTGYQDAPLGGATLEILDGINQGQRVVTDVQGRYSFARLHPGEFTVRATAEDHATATKGVMLTADTSLEFQLRVLLAQFVVVGTLAVANGPDGTLVARGQSSNIGDGCAAQITGTANFRDVNGAIVTTLVWSAPPGTIVRPGEQVSYEFCCVSSEQAVVIRRYEADFRGTTVRCS
jgi:hypothetical protein